MPRPIPCPPPVTMAILPSSCIMLPFNVAAFTSCPSPDGRVPGSARSAAAPHHPASSAQPHMPTPPYALAMPSLLSPDLTRCFTAPAPIDDVTSTTLLFCSVLNQSVHFLNVKESQLMTQM